MPDINLLPWREEQREERKRQFLSALVLVAILAGVIGFVWNSLVVSRIDGQLDRNSLLEAQIKLLDSEANEIRSLKEEKAEMLDRMEVIKGLQINRPEIVKLYDQLVTSMPDGVYISDLEVSGSRLSMQGKAESNNRISALMRQLNQAEKFSDPNLAEVTADRELGSQGSQFTMTAVVTSPDTFEE